MQTNTAQLWAQRGRVVLISVLACLGLTYLADRIIYHSVQGFGSTPATVVTTLLIALMCFLIYRGYGWLRWLVALYFVLSGLGMPAGARDVFGPGLTALIALLSFAAHVGFALALCFAPGIPAFLRSQRTQRQKPSQAPAPAADS